MPTGPRGEHAATTTEYALVLAALAAVVAAALGPGTAAVAGAARRAWCALGAATSAAAPARGAAPRVVVDPWDDPDPLRRATWGRVAVLGDSFASGEGNGGYGVAGSDRRCHAGTSAHGAVVARALRPAGGVAVAACSGARLADLAHRRHAHPPQLDALDEGTSLVLLTLGGNDVGWTDAIRTCVAAELVPIGADCREGDERDRELDRRIDGLHDELVAAYRRVRERAPHARVVVTGYPRFFPAIPFRAYRQGGAVVLDADTQAWVNAETRRLDDVIRRATVEAGVEYVDVADTYDGHELTSDDPWFHGIEYRCCVGLEPGSLHPNRAGQAALARAVEAAVRHPIR